MYTFVTHATSLACDITDLVKLAALMSVFAIFRRQFLPNYNNYDLIEKIAASVYFFFSFYYPIHTERAHIAS